MRVQAGQCYVDGWGNQHTIVGPVPGRPGVWYASSGYWFLDDGRLQYRVSSDMCNHDLVGPVIGPAPGELHAISTTATDEARLPHSTESAGGVENDGHTEVQPGIVQARAE